jgi:hypothetical protein
LNWDSLDPGSGWQAAPVAVTNWAATPQRFIETGPIKDCRAGKDCRGHPYISAEDTNGMHRFQVAGVFLGDAGRYTFRSFHYTGTGTGWRGEYCDGNGCHFLEDYDLGEVKLERVAVALESTDNLPLAPWVETFINEYRRADTTTYVDYCYDTYYENVSAPSATGCVYTTATGAYSWTVNGR